MAGNPQVLGLIVEMLDSGKTPLLPEVRQRWQEFHQIDAEVGALFPGLRTGADAGASALAPCIADLPHVPGYDLEAVLGHGGMGIVYEARQRVLGRPIALKMLLRREAEATVLPNLSALLGGPVRQRRCRTAVRRDLAR
jgi:hypothetical protein